MKKILFLGSSNGTCDMIKYAQSQGFYTIVLGRTNFQVEKRI